MAAFGFRHMTEDAREALQRLGVDVHVHASMIDVLMPDDTRVEKIEAGSYRYLIRETVFVMRENEEGESIFDVVADCPTAEAIRERMLSLAVYTRRALI